MGGKGEAGINAILRHLVWCGYWVDGDAIVERGQDKYLEGKRMSRVCGIFSGRCLQDIRVEKAGRRLSGVSEWALHGVSFLMGESPVNTLHLNFPVLCKPPD